MQVITEQRAVIEEAPAARRRRRFDRVRRRAAVLVVVLACLAGGAAALGLFEQERNLGYGTVDLAVDIGHPGALDLYVPVVDWGVRFHAVRLPVRLRVEVRSVDRDAVKKVAEGSPVDIGAVRARARSAIAGYIRELLLVVFLAALAAGLVGALVVRGGSSPRLRVLFGVAGAATVIGTLLLFWLLPPRGSLANPQYYAHGSDIPAALNTLEAVQRSSGRLDDELNDQLVGLARLVIRPGNRAPIEGRPRVTLASDLHNNILDLPILERAARGGPVFFPGDLTDRGSPLETSLTRRVVRSGRPFVFVSGNHDSDRLQRQLVRAGAIVLTRFGQLERNGSYGPMVVRVAGLRVAGYDSDWLRLARQNYRDRYRGPADAAVQAGFTEWLRPLIGRVDVVLLHDVTVAGQALQLLTEHPPRRPLILVVGHTHHASVQHYGPAVTVIDDGSIGAGGIGNLTKHNDIALATLTYSRAPFQPLAADVVTIDPGTGSSTAVRDRLDGP